MLKLALGTAQLGLDYGINNPRGKVPAPEAISILAAASRGGIDTLDTARAYGESEGVIGAFLRSGAGSFRVATKVKGSSAREARDSLAASLAALGSSSVYACLIHDFGAFDKDPSAWRALEEMKGEGLAAKIGFSLYRPGELERLLDRGPVPGVVQIPLSVFDQRFLPLLGRAKDRGVEIHARSAFLQGLAFKDPDSLDGRFAPIREPLLKLAEIARREGIPAARLCLAFTAGHPWVDRAVAGVDSPAHLEDLLSYRELPAALLAELAGLRVDDESVLLPFRWAEGR